MQLLPKTNVKPFRFETVERPWGYYGLYADNEVCTAKILYIRKNETLSLQYHFLRDQFYLLLDDDFIIQYSLSPINPDIINIQDDALREQEIQKFLSENLIEVYAKANDMFGFHRLIVHRASYIGSNKYGRILDIAFGNNDENDIIRLVDKYGRSNQNFTA